MNTLPPALQYLEKLQREAEKRIGPEYQNKRIREDSTLHDAQKGSPRIAGVLPASVIEEMRAFHEQRYAALRAEIPETQSVIDYSILKQIKTDFDHLITHAFQNADQYNTSAGVYFGTVESPVLNALITSVPESEQYLVVMNRGLWVSISAMTFLLSASLKFDQVPIPFGFDPEKAWTHQEFFAQILNLLLDREVVMQYPPHDFHSVENQYWELVDTAAKDFAFGHEYGHFLKNHFEREAGSKRAAVAVGRIEVPASLTSWRNEYEADRTGLDLTVFRSRGFWAELARDEPAVRNELTAHGILLGVEGALIILNLLLQAERVRGVVHTPESSHPPTWMRIQSIWSAVAQQARDPATFQHARERLEYSTRAIEFFFQAAVPRTVEVPVERLFQDLAFRALFQHTHRDVISLLNTLRDLLQSRSFFSTTARERAGGSPGSELYDLLQLAIGKHEVPPEACIGMVQNCIQVLEKNFRAIRFDDA
jgi:hypothetical protein